MFAPIELNPFNFFLPSLLLDSSSRCDTRSAQLSSLNNSRMELQNSNDEVAETDSSSSTLRSMPVWAWEGWTQNRGFFQIKKAQIQTLHLKRGFSVVLAVREWRVWVSLKTVLVARGGGNEIGIAVDGSSCGCFWRRHFRYEVFTNSVFRVEVFKCQQWNLERRWIWWFTATVQGAIGMKLLSQIWYAKWGGCGARPCSSGDKEERRPKTGARWWSVGDPVWLLRAHDGGAVHEGQTMTSLLLWFSHLAAPLLNFRISGC